MFVCLSCHEAATTEIYTLSLHDALPISRVGAASPWPDQVRGRRRPSRHRACEHDHEDDSSALSRIDQAFRSFEELTSNVDVLKGHAMSIRAADQHASMFGEIRLRHAGDEWPGQMRDIGHHKPLTLLKLHRRISHDPLAQSLGFTVGLSAAAGERPDPHFDCKAVPLSRDRSKRDLSAEAEFS